MTKKIYWLALLSIFSFSCNSLPGDEALEANSEANVFKFPNIKDTLITTAALLETFEKPVAEYRILYIGPYKDTITPNPRINPGSLPPPPLPGTVKKETLDTILEIYQKVEKQYERYFIDWDFVDEEKFPSPALGTIQILIDTTSIITNINHLVESTRPTVYKAYPVIIANNSPDTIITGLGPFLNLILEAKDSTGTWLPIENKYYEGCINGYRFSLLPPSEILLTSATIYNGGFYTSLRLKMGNHHSREFKGAINYTFFHSEK